jgi:hypothetical protein
MSHHMAGEDNAGKTLSRRLGTGALAFGAMAAFAGRSALGARPQKTSKKISKVTLTDADILNFALNLEYLEAEYYIRAVTGNPLSTYLSGVNGTVLAPPTTLVPFQTPAIANWALRIANDELSHVRFLLEGIKAEGATPVAEPELDLLNSFTTLAIAAGLIEPGQTFNPFASEIDFMVGAYIFEDVGVTAYAGAAAALTNPANIAYGASILAVEAEHAGCIRSYLAGAGGGAVTNAISALRQTVSTVQDNGTMLSGNPFSFANNDYNGQVFRRTPQEVLNVVYGTPGTGITSGLFFPNGMNGTLTST